MGLFEPAWRSEKEEKALRAVAKLKSEAALIRAAREAKCLQARKVALNKLTDQTVLAHEAMHNDSTFARAAAASKLTD